MTNLAAKSSPEKMYWKETKEKLKQIYSKLNDDDLFYYEGKKEEMLNKIQNKLGVTKKELTTIIENL